MTTVTQDIAAITVTGTAKTSAGALGHNLDAQMQTLALHIVETKRCLAQIVLLHPAGDSSLTALNAIQAKL